MSKISDKTKPIISSIGKNPLEAFMVFFVVFRLAQGLLRIFDYGLSWDEGFGYVQLLGNKNYINALADWLLKGEDHPDTSWFEEWFDKDYGIASRLPLLLGDMKFPVFGEMRGVFQLYHVYQYMLFIIAVFAMYKIGRFLGFSLRISLFGCMMLVMMPRFYAEAVYNYKDLTFVCMYIISFAVGLWLLKKWTIWRILLFSFVTAVCVNTRYIGAILFFYIIVVYALQKNERKRCWNIILVGLLVSLFYFIMSPFLWEHPLQGLFMMVSKFSSFPWTGSILFNGDVYAVENLPRSYLITWIGMTLPIWISVLIIIGTGIGTRVLILWIKKHDWSKLEISATGRIFCFIVAWGTLLADYILHPLKYDGWRHFYFLYVSFVVIAMFGMEQLLYLIKQKRVKIAIVVAIALLMTTDLLWMEQNHPFEYMYFNPIARPVADQYEGDYWLVSTYNAAEEVLQVKTDQPLKVWVAYNVGLWYLRPDEAERIVLCGGANEADIVIYHPRAERLYDDLGMMDWREYEIWREKETDGNLIYAILIKKDSPVYASFAGK